jgi:predicted Zn-dependent protease
MTTKLSKNIVVLMLFLFYWNVSTAEDISENSLLSRGALAKISNIYSNIDMRVHLAIKPNAKQCIDDLCALNMAFDEQVQRLGNSIAVAAYAAYPSLRERIEKFTFIVVNIEESGMASNSTGTIFVFRGIQYLKLGDDALSFILAREIGHVIGSHNNKNTFTKLIFSALASILFPVGSILSTSNLAAQTAVTTMASATTSYVGSEVVISQFKPSQHIESDNIALNVLANQDMDIRLIVATLDIDDDFGSNSWMQDLKSTMHRIKSQFNM